jgi:hypothetical protein
MKYRLLSWLEETVYEHPYYIPYLVLVGMARGDATS